MSLNLSVYFNFRLVRGGSFLLLAAVLISGCGSNPPKDMDNICKIFEENRSWYKASVKSK